MNILPALVRACPDCYQTLVDTAGRWLNEDGTVSPCAVMSVMARFVIERLQQCEYEDMTEIFDTAEQMLASGSAELKDAVATCFLENLLNATPRRLDAASFVPLLGPLSGDYCRAWDKFTGVETQGLR